MPRILNIVGFHTIFKCSIYFTFEYFLLPTHMACVLSAFKNRPDTFPNLLIASIDFLYDFCSLHCSLVVCHLRIDIFVFYFVYPDSLDITIFSNHDC